ncbi:hypothetical protein N656DRAFT_782851 [Canariomyces notabilis]|uniref:Clr5 domain-containing protein n=1 Tax=Canariomyces notabilis TaxID=2074819 RepID=A0AAN6QH82_9PEZI|nr:hypothetical protein N656DRAFT_782851 [Canariomyces arenarius]
MTRFVTQRHNARRIPSETWEKFKPILRSKYLDENRTLNDVMEHMKTEHSFDATRRQYIHQFDIWGFRKYTKSDQPAPPTRLPRRSPAKRSDARPSSNKPRPLAKDTLSSRARPVKPFAAQAPAALTLSLPASTVKPPATPAPEPYQVRLDSDEAVNQHRWLADILKELGDAHYSFGVYRALYEKTHPNGKRLVASIFACVRTAQTDRQANEVQKMLVNDMETVQEHGENTCSNFLFDLMWGHAQGPDLNAESDRIQLLEKAINDNVVDDGGLERLRTLKPRGPSLDIPTFVLLGSTLAQYNQCTDFDVEEEYICNIDVLEQFRSQQPAFSGDAQNTDPLLQIDCLMSCLKWCLVVLQHSPSIPQVIRVTDGNEVTEAYQVLLTLWCILVRSCMPSLSDSNILELENCPNLDISWAEKAHQQLDISATELLSTMVGMMLAATSTKHETGTDAAAAALDRALDGARALEKLSTLSSETLILRFLNQVLAHNLQLMVPLEDDIHHSADSNASFEEAVAVARMITPFRDFATKVLGIQGLPPLAPGVSVCPALLEPAMYALENRWLEPMGAYYSSPGLVAHGMMGVPMTMKGYAEFLTPEAFSRLLSSTSEMPENEEKQDGEKATKGKDKDEKSDGHGGRGQDEMDIAFD